MHFTGLNDMNVLRNVRWINPGVVSRVKKNSLRNGHSKPWIRLASAFLQAQSGSILGWPSGFFARRVCRWHQRIKCGDTFFNSVRFCFSWFGFAAMSRRRLTSGITQCRQARHRIQPGDPGFDSRSRFWAYPCGRRGDAHLNANILPFVFLGRLLFLGTSPGR